MLNDVTDSEAIMNSASSAIVENSNEQIDVDNAESGKAYADAIQKEKELSGRETKPESTNEVWFYEDGMPGVGEKPEWFNSAKYKSVSEQAKAQRELEKKFGGFKGAPKDYNFDLPNHGDVKFEKGDPLIQSFEKLARESNMSQELVTQCLETYVSAIKSNSPNYEEEIAKLGPTAKTEIETLQSWLSNHFTSSEIETLQSMSLTAEQIKIMQKMRKLTQENRVAIKNQNDVVNKRHTEKELQTMVGDKRYGKDMVYTNEVDKKFAMFYG